MNTASLVRSKAPVTIRLSLALFASVVVLALVPGALDALALNPCEPNYKHFLLGAVLHPFAMSGLVHWLAVSIPLLLSAVVTERELGVRWVAALWLTATSISALAYPQLATSCIPFIGPACFAWAFAGTVLAAVPQRWGKAHAWEKVYVVFIAIFALAMLGTSLVEAVISLAGIALGATALLIAQKRHRKRTTHGATAA